MSISIEPVSINQKSVFIVEIPSSTDLVKVLIVDPDVSTRQTLAGYLKDSGYDAFEAGDAKTAIQMMSSEKPELVLCDLHLPEINDINVLKQIAESYADVPIIVISGEGQMSDVVDALRLGAADFLMKPIKDLVLLEHAIERSLERYSLRHQNMKYRAQLEQANSDLKNNLAVLEQDQQAGLQIQMKMLPVNPMQKGAYVFTHQIVPSLYLSGDFVEYLTVGSDHVVMFVADVSGHGASSAFVTVLLKNLTARMRSDFNRKNNEAVLHPAEFLAQANAELLDTGIGKHATLFYAVLNTRRNSLKYSVAGQLPLPILITNDEAEYIEGQGAPVGLFEETYYEEYQMDLPERFKLMMFSDGILEVLNETSLSKKEAYLLECAPTLRADTEAVLHKFGVDSTQQYPDDIAVLIVEKH